MKKMTKIAATFCLCAAAVQAQAERLVTIGPGVTEIVYALGQGDKIIGADDASKTTEGADIKKVGYHRQLSSEGLLSLKLDRIIGTDDMGPPVVLEHLEKAGVAVTTLPGGYQLEGLEARITELAKTFASEEKGKELWASVEKKLNEAADLAKAAKDKSGKPQKIIFMMAHGGTPLLAGNNTAANALIELAGGQNPAKVSFPGYKPVSAESLLTMAPDVIVVGNSTFNNAGSVAGILKLLPGIQATPAGKNGTVIAVDDTTLMGGLSPRIGDVALKLAQDVYTR
ncbi:heme/hemin ABC transporter substrate-binding protein [Parendozoicomonas haliclonae]|uniref:Hemin-binding periplasmic protein HmuT n=1 Tax=Parendozoicomonas haliclonae TaxID=1960125 RepID=A0A1X7AIH9_9GAMM|nr:ABC transporter substrate-binding protein [Parendozoicomonas haliclonae]SMA44875.1 Hemin-binding periplasmic protein HmuT precursor [Parendozoicomonas haliclonae]